MYVDYYVNEAKRTVICKLTDVSHSVLGDLARKGFMANTPAVYSFALLKDSFVGKAKCSDDDEFDAEKGKRIAYKRAIAKMNRSKAKLCQAIIRDETKHFHRFTGALNSLYQKYVRINASSESDCDNIISGAVGQQSKSKMAPDI